MPSVNAVVGCRTVSIIRRGGLRYISKLQRELATKYQEPAASRKAFPAPKSSQPDDLAKILRRGFCTVDGRQVRTYPGDVLLSHLSFHTLQLVQQVAYRITISFDDIALSLIVILSFHRGHSSVPRVIASRPSGWVRSQRGRSPRRATRRGR